MKNIEFDLLIEIVKVGYLNEDSQNLVHLVNTNTIIWQEFQRLADFHSIRPIVFQAFKNADLSHLSCFTYYSDFIKNQTFYNLSVSNQLAEILNDFKNIGMIMLPYKGLLFLHKLFDNRQLREIGDTDLLVKTNEIKKSIEYFKTKGFRVQPIHVPKNLDSEELEDAIINSKGQNEIAIVNEKLSLDVHWQLNYEFLHYKVDYLAYFKNAKIEKFLGHECYVPDQNTIFWMIILHNGGKEFWVKLKHLIDLMAFMSKYASTSNWAELILKAKEYHIYKVMLQGFYLLQKTFNYHLPVEIQIELKKFGFKEIDLIEDFWLFAKNWDKPRSRMKYERILLKSQDEGFSYVTYFINVFKQYSIPTPLDHPRLWVFPEKYYFLNFISKIISYLVRGIKK